MEKNLTIEKMKIDDIDNVLYLESTHNIQILSKNTLKNELENDNYYYIVAKENGRIVGYAGIGFVIDSADLVSIVVDKERTKHGIGSMLLQNIFAFCKENNIREILLEVRQTNFDAQRLYEKFGFKQISVRKKYYKDGENAVIMKKNKVAI